MWFSHPATKKCWTAAVRPQSCLTQVTAHFLFLLLWSVFSGAPCYRSFFLYWMEYRGERGTERYEIGGKTEKKKKEEKKQRGSTYVKTAQRRSEKQRKQSAHVHEADGVSVRERGREGGWLRVRWERRYFSVLLRERGREMESGGRDLLFMCVR